MTPEPERRDARGRAQRPRPDRALPHGVHLGRDDGRSSRPPSAATSSPTRTCKLPGWVPVLGHNYYTLKADFQTAQAVTPGQGQAVTIAGREGRRSRKRRPARRRSPSVTMKVTPKYAHFYRNATLLLRPKTQLQDITVEVNPGTPSAGKLRERRSAAALADRPERQLRRIPRRPRRRNARLPAGAAGRRRRRRSTTTAARSRRRSSASSPRRATAQRSSASSQSARPTSRRSIHNFSLLMRSARHQGQADRPARRRLQRRVPDLRQGGRRTSQSTLHLLPGALHKTGNGLGKLATATDVIGPALHKLDPFAKALGPAQEATQTARDQDDADHQERNPAVRARNPADGQRTRALAPKALGEAFPKLATSFSVLNEFFNELAYNPGKGKAGFDCSSSPGPTTTSTASSAPPTPTARSAAASSTSTAKSFRIFERRAEVNPTVKLLVGLLKPPTRPECVALGLRQAETPTTAAARARTKASLARRGQFSKPEPR